MIAFNLSGYEAIEWFYPHYSEAADADMQSFIRAHQLEDDPTDLFYLVSPDRFFVMIINSSNHERDSSYDAYVVYRRKMSG